MARIKPGSITADRNGRSLYQAAVDPKRAPGKAAFKRMQRAAAAKLPMRPAGRGR